MPVTIAELRTMEIEATDAFLRGLQSTSNVVWNRIAKKVAMRTKTIEAPIAGMIGQMREWVGEREVERLSRDAHSITAKPYEKTVSVPREAVEDDNVGVYMAQLETLGQMAALLPDYRVAEKLEAGETDLCYDGTAFFGTLHPVERGNPDTAVFSNLTGSGSPAWYLFDTRKAVLPLVWGNRTDPEMATLWDPEDPNVFWKNEYVSGVYARGVADYGLPHLAHKSKAALDATNFETALASMNSRKGPKGEKLGVHPTLAVIPSSLRSAAQRLWGREKTTGGEDNVHYKAIEWVVWDRLSDT